VLRWRAESGGCCAPQIPIALAPIWLLYGYVAPVLDEYVGDAATRDAQ
jgi:hypothetical protein